MAWPSRSPPPTPGQTAQGQCPPVHLPCLGQGTVELSASWPLALLSLHRHSWRCSLWSLSEPVCFPSASSSLGITLGSTAVSAPWGIAQQLGRGSLPLWGPAAWAGTEGWSPQCCPIQTGYMNGLLLCYPSVWGQAKYKPGRLIRPNWFPSLSIELGERSLAISLCSCPRV